MARERITTITIDGVITIKHPPAPLLKQIENKIRLKNPAYWPAVKKNPKAKYALNKHIEYFNYDEDEDTLTLPRGLESRVARYFESADHKYEKNINTSYYPVNKIEDEIILRDYQKDVLDPITNDDKAQGIFRADTGFGKSICAIKIATHLKQRALIVTPKVDILEQFISEISNFTDTTPGRIQGKYFDIQPITVATIQTLQNRLDKIPAHTFGTTIWDECHMYVPKKSRAVVNHFNAHYRYGFTATPKRSDGQGKAIKWIFGDIIYDKKLPREDPEVHVYPFDGHIWTQEYHEMVEQQVENDDRNKLIADIINSYVNKDRTALVLTKRIKHYELLFEKLQTRDPVRPVKVYSDERGDGVLQEIKENPEKHNCVLATFGLFSTGVDIPHLDTIVLAGDLKSSVLTEQSAGRVLRLFDDKEEPTIIDIHDTKNKVFHKQHNARCRVYKDKGWEIKQKEI